MTLAERSPMKLVILAAMLLPDCVDDLMELTPTIKRDMTTAQSPDLAESQDTNDDDDANKNAPTPEFDPEIQADITTLDCATTACHNDTQFPPLLTPNPVTTNDKQANYDNFKAKSLINKLSTMLTKNLTKNKISHINGSSFANKNDTIYKH